MINQDKGKTLVPLVFVVHQLNRMPSLRSLTRSLLLSIITIVANKCYLTRNQAYVSVFCKKWTFQVTLFKVNFPYYRSKFQLNLVSLQIDERFQNAFPEYKSIPCGKTTGLQSQEHQIMKLFHKASGGNFPSAIS